MAKADELFEGYNNDVTEMKHTLEGNLEDPQIAMVRIKEDNIFLCGEEQ